MDIFLHTNISYYCKFLIKYQFFASFFSFPFESKSNTTLCIILNLKQ